MAVDLGSIDTLIMAGGGNRCWWQAGLVQALMQHGWTLPRNITATSAGAAIATSLLTGTTESALVACKKLYSANAQLFDWRALMRLKVKFAHQHIYPAWLNSLMGDGDYTLHVTFNDDVMGENIKFMTMCVMALGETRLIGNIERAMECMRLMQQPGPQAGWSLQHLSRPTGGRPAGAPAGARSYEPRSLATHTTRNSRSLLRGDRAMTSRSMPTCTAYLMPCGIARKMTQTKNRRETSSAESMDELST